MINHSDSSTSSRVPAVVPPRIRRRDRILRRPSARPEQRPLPGQPAAPRFTRYFNDGQVIDTPDDTTLGEDLDYMAKSDDHMVLTLYPQPTNLDITELSEAWQLHPMLVEDLLHGGQRSKMERYDGVQFLVVRSADYVDELEEVFFSEFHIIQTTQAVAIFCQDNRWINGQVCVDKEGKLNNEEAWEKILMGQGDELPTSPQVMVYRFVDAIVDGYRPVLRGIAIDKEQIERQVFSGDQAVAERIYRLSQEIIDMQHTTTSLVEVMQQMQRHIKRHPVDEQLRAYVDDASDHLTSANAHVAEFRDAMSQILSVNATLVTERQNEDMKKISGWAAILFAPTLVAAIYGMNFDRMPELHWVFGYPMALFLMLAFAIVLRLVFKRSKWM